MKRIIWLVVLIFAFPVSGFSETYTVLKVIETVLIDGKPAKAWSRISDDAVLTFGDADAALRVMAGNKSMVISGVKPEKTSGGDRLIAKLKKAYIQSPQIKRASAKGAITTRQDFRAFLTASNDPEKVNPFLIIDSGKYHIRPDIFLLDGEDHFFFLYYRYDGEDVNKMLPNAGENHFLITPDIFVLNKGTSDEKKVNPAEIAGDIVFYYAVDPYKDDEICTFKPVFVTTEDMKPELTVVRDILRSQGATDKEIKDFIGDYLATYYGDAGEDALNDWLKRHLGLSP